MFALWVRCLVLVAVLACWSASALPSLVGGAGPERSQAHAVAAHQVSAVADPQHATAESGGLSGGLTGYLVGLGLVISLIGLVGLRACERQSGNRRLGSHRRL